MPEKPLIYLIAGEVSGDLLGGRLMRALRSLTRDGVAFAGIGGAAMQAEGLASLFPMTDLSVMGISEVIGCLPLLLRRISETERDILARKPAVVVTIDAPDFTLHVAKRVRKKAPGIRLVHYIAPSVWAWRPGRAAKIAAFLDHLLAVLPFEPPYFTQVGLPCSFVGHPAVEETTKADAASFRASHGLQASDQVLLLLPGSRGGELKRMLPLMIECAQDQALSRPKLKFVVPTLPHLRNAVGNAFIDSGLTPIIIGPDEKADAFAAATAALATSGTVALELGIAGVPSVICYRATRLTAFIARRLVKLKHVSLINLVMNREVMPEFLQQDATPACILPALETLLDSEAARAKQIASFREAVMQLKPHGESPSLAAARIVLQVAAIPQA